MLRIRICRIHIFSGLPDPDPLVRATDPASDFDPDPSMILLSIKNSKKNIDSYCFVTSLPMTFIFEKGCKFTFKKYGKKQKTETKKIVLTS